MRAAIACTSGAMAVTFPPAAAASSTVELSGWLSLLPSR
jgi:hypothetical protein